MSNSFLLELVAKLPSTVEELTALRKKFSRKTSQCIHEILSMIAKAVARIKEEERQGSKPAVIKLQKSEHQSQNKLNLVANELRADDSITELSFQLSEMKIKLDDAVSGNETNKIHDELGGFSQDLFNFPKKNGKLSRQIVDNEEFKFDSFLDYLRQIYPSITISPSKKLEGRIEDELTGNKPWQLPEKVVSDDFIGIGDKKTLVNDQGEEEDIVEKVDHSLLPASLKEKFKIDLLKIKKKDFTSKVVEKKHKKPNTMQSTSREIFEKGNVFEVLKSKEVDQMSEDEGRISIMVEEGLPEEENSKQKGFWEAYQEATEKLNSGKKDIGPRVGEFGGSTKGKKKKDKHKTAQFSKPSMKSAIKF